MQLSADPVRTLNRGTFAVAALAAIGMAACALWAFRAQRSEDGVMTRALETAVVAAAETPTVLAIDERAFQAHLWTTPAVEATPAAPPATPAPRTRQPELEIELVGIIDQGNAVRHAALYVTKEDRIVIIAIGESIGGLELTAITADGVELSGGGSTRQLALREDR